jgi:hypothetical protein
MTMALQKLEDTTAWQARTLAPSWGRFMTYSAVPVAPSGVEPALTPSGGYDAIRRGSIIRASWRRATAR